MINKKTILVLILLTVLYTACKSVDNKGVLVRKHLYTIDSLRSICKGCKEIESSENGKVLVKSVGGTDLEMFKFDSLGNYVMYTFCSSMGKPKYNMHYKEGLEFVKAEGSTLYIQRKECIDNNEDEMFIMSPTPPFFDIELEFYSRKDSGEFVFDKLYNVKDDRPVIIKDTTFFESVTKRIILKMYHDDYLVVDTVEINRPLCDQGVEPRIAVTE